GPAGGTFGFPSLASDGSGFLVVWQGTRTGSPGELRMARLDANGALLDPFGLPLPAVAGSMYANQHAVAFGAGMYLVVYGDPSVGSSCLRAVRVSTAGALLDATPLV